MLPLHRPTFSICQSSTNELDALAALFLHQHSFYDSQGIIDIDKELSSLKTKSTQLVEKKTKLEETINKPDYENKVPESVREDNSNRVCIHCQVGEFH